MNKKLKSLFAVVVMVAMLFVLTGCGSKLVATKSTDDSMMGKYEEKIEVSFKGDKADKIVWTMEFDDENKAKAAAGVYGLASSEDSKIDVDQKGKKVTLKMSAKDFGSSDEDVNKDDMKKQLEDMGYTVK